MPVLKFNVAIREMSFVCECGREVRVPFDELKPEPFDYCGCGSGWRVVTLEEIAQHRALRPAPYRAQ